MSYESTDTDPHCWKHKFFYPSSSDELNTWQWRWEFLRRSREYIEAWEAADSVGDEDDLLRIPKPIIDLH
jgi:hypothetical protein